MSTLAFCLVPVLVTLLLAALALRRLRLDRQRWERRQANRWLYDQVNGAVLVKDDLSYSIHRPQPGLVPDGSVIIIDPSIGLLIAADPPGFTFRDTTDWWENRWTHPYRVPVVDPRRSFIPPSVS